MQGLTVAAVDRNMADVPFTSCADSLYGCVVVKVTKYELVQLTSGIPWTTAKAQAAQKVNSGGQQGFLATIADSTDMATVNSLIASSLTAQSPGCWLGATRAGTSSGGWEWVGGGVWNYTNWETNEPLSGKDYLGVSTTAGPKVSHGERGPVAM